MPNLKSISRAEFTRRIDNRYVHYEWARETPDKVVSVLTEYINANDTSTLENSGRINVTSATRMHRVKPDGRRSYFSFKKGDKCYSFEYNDHETLIIDSGWCCVVYVLLNTPEKYGTITFTR